MQHYAVKVYTEKLVYIETISGVGDLASACAAILRDGVITSDENGPIWIPPHRIMAVRLVS